MAEHTTHFDDCGCLAEQHAAEMKKALAERDAALRENLYYEKKVAGLEAEAERMFQRLQHAAAVELFINGKLEPEEPKAARLAAIAELREWAQGHNNSTSRPDIYIVELDNLLAKLDAMEKEGGA